MPTQEDVQFRGSCGWPGREWPPSPCPFSPPWLWEQALAPSSARHLGGWREPPPAALTAFKGTARNRRGHPTACVGLAASECPFCRLSVHFAKSAQPRLPGSRGEGAVGTGPCSRLLRMCPDTSPQHGPADASLPASWQAGCGHRSVSQMQRHLTAPSSTAQAGQAPAGSVVAGALRCTPLLYSQETVQSARWLAQSHYLPAAEPGHQPTAPHPSQEPSCP